MIRQLWAVLLFICLFYVPASAAKGGGAPVIVRQPQDALVPYEDAAGEHNHIFSCDAAAFDGAADELSYRWETETPSGWQAVPGAEGSAFTWSDRASGPDDGAGCAYFRCVVTDRRTGDTTVSREAMAGVRLTLQVDRAVIEPAAGQGTVYFTVRGGAAPYHVSLYAHRLRGTVRQDLVFEYYWNDNAALGSMLQFSDTLEEDGRYDAAPTDRLDYGCYDLVYTYDAFRDRVMTRSFETEFFLVVADGSGQRYQTPYLQHNAVAR